MTSTVLYRKWRPHDFDQVIGQEPVVRTLRNAVAQDKISHAYLFCGPRGTGKTTTARILARAINHIDSDDGGALGGGDMGFDLIEIDAASNRGIDDIRELRERANYQPGSVRFKVYLIDEVHQLTGAASDALLKTLEEPPPHVVFILATTDPEALTPTILSRCQRFDFRRVSVDDMVGRLRQIADQEGIAIPDDALRLIAREATGSLRDGVNLLDQVWTTCGADITLAAAQETLGLSPDARALDLAAAALRKDLAAGLAVINAVQDDAIDFQRFKKQVVAHLRHILLISTGAAETLSLSDPESEQLRAAASGANAQAVAEALRHFADADVRRDPYQPLPLELALADIVYGPEAPAAPAAPQAAAPAPQAQPERRQQQRPAKREARAASLPRHGQPAPNAQAAAAPAAAPAQPAPSPAPRRQQPPAPAQRPAAARPAANLSADEQLLVDMRNDLREAKLGRLSAILNGSCRVLERTDGALTLGFPPNFQGFHLQEVEQSITQVSQSASRVLNRAVTVRCVAVDDESPAVKPPEPQAEARPQPTQPAPAQHAVAQPPKAGFGAAASPAEPMPEPKPSPMVADAQRRFGARIVSN